MSQLEERKTDSKAKLIKIVQSDDQIQYQCEFKSKSDTSFRIYYLQFQVNKSILIEM